MNLWAIRKPPAAGILFFLTWNSGQERSKKKNILSEDKTVAMESKEQKQLINEEEIYRALGFTNINHCGVVQ